MPRHEMSIDPTHSFIEFAVTYAMNTIIKGRFQEFSGTLVLDTDDPASSKVSVQINANSINTGAERRDGHLKGDDFFSVETHDELRFESTSVDVVDDSRWQVHGDLTILDTSRPVTLDTGYYGIVQDAMGDTRAGFVGETDINRSDWDMDWNAEQETGVLVSDRVRVSLYISAIPVEDDAVEQDDGDA
ncbi:YceI family protein [soil metagenome]